MEDLVRVRNLMRHPVTEFTEMVMQVDAQTGEILTLLRNMDVHVAFIRETRNELHWRLMAWDEVIAAWAARVPRVVVTDGPRGARLWRDHQDVAHVPAFAVPEADPTGAGDTFAAAFLIALWRGRDPLDAMRYAHAAASYVVTTQDTSGMPTEEQIAARLAAKN